LLRHLAELSMLFEIPAHPNHHEQDPEHLHQQKNGYRVVEPARRSPHGLILHLSGAIAFEVLRKSDGEWKLMEHPAAHVPDPASKIAFAVPRRRRLGVRRHDAALVIPN
jgi:hypothetical protein